MRVCTHVCTKREERQKQQCDLRDGQVGHFPILLSKIPQYLRSLIFVHNYAEGQELII